MTSKLPPAFDPQALAAQFLQGPLSTPDTQAFGNAMGEVWKTMSGVALPADALTKLQSDYLAQATALWNDALSHWQQQGTPPAPTGAPHFTH